MLYVDANSCVGCGACTTACPVDAILPETVLAESQQPFIALNAEYYDVFPHTDRRPLAVVAKQRRLTRPGPFRVAVVGAGPAGLYTADELLKHPEVRSTSTTGCPRRTAWCGRASPPTTSPPSRSTELFRAIEDQPGFRYFLGVEIGEDLSHEELTAQYHAVVYSVGAASDRASASRGRSCRARARAPTWSVGTTATPTSRTSWCRSTTTGRSSSATATSRSTWRGSSPPTPMPWPRPTSPRFR